MGADSLKKVMNMRKIIVTLLGLILVMSFSAVLLGAETRATDVPTLEVGEGAAFGKIMNLTEVLQPELAQMANELETLGLDTNIETTGNLGVFVSTEVIDNSTSINGDNCYDVQISGAVCLDAYFDVEIDGFLDGLGIYDTEGSVDATANGFVTLEANLWGHIYYTIDELAISKIDMKMTINGEAGTSIDFSMIDDYGLTKIEMDVEMSINDIKLDLEVSYNPPINFFDFPINEDEQWSIPEWDTDVEIESSAEGIISYEMAGYMTSTSNADGGGAPVTDTVNEYAHIDLADEIGYGTDEYTIYEEYGTPLKCTGVDGELYTIEIDFSQLMDMDTRQENIYDIIPEINAGFVYYQGTGLIAGASINGEIITTPTTQDTVVAFSEQPLNITQDAEELEFEAVEIDYDDGFNDPIIAVPFELIALIVIVIVAVTIIVIVVSKKKAPPVQQYPQQPGQQPSPDQYQQPPPPPPPGY